MLNSSVARPWKEEHVTAGFEAGPRGARIRPAEGPVLDLRAKEPCFKKSQKVDPLEIKVDNIQAQSSPMKKLLITVMQA